MPIAKTNTVPIDARPSYPKRIANNSKAFPFSTLMQQIRDNKAASAQEASHQKHPESSCDCEECAKCDSRQETEEAVKAKKSGIAACMDCILRKNGQCAMWNGEKEDSIFNLFPINSHNNAMRVDLVKISGTQAPLNVIPKASSEYDYTYTYAYMYLRPRLSRLAR